MSLEDDSSSLISKISYSNRYESDDYIFRHVKIPPQLLNLVPRNRLMSEAEWRSLGVKQSIGWEHYMIHDPEPHILLFRRKK